MVHAITECIHQMPSDRQSVYAGSLLEYRQRLLHPRKFVYCITDVVVKTPHGPRALFLTLGCGCKLYEYIHSGGRFSRLPDLYFEFVTQTDRQRVQDFRAHDPDGWLLDNTARGRG